MLVRSALAGVALALGVAACGATNAAQTVPTAATADTGAVSTPAVSAPSDTDSATGTTPAPSVSTPAATVTTATITTPDAAGAPNSGGGALTGTATTAASGPECTASSLSASAVPPNSAPGTTVLGFILANTSGSGCVSGAFPGIGLIDSAGGVDAVSTRRVTSDALGSTPVTRVSLGAGQTMSFRITLHDSGADCGSYTGVQIIAPNDTATLRVTIPDGPVESCGSVDVSPVEPGASATGQ